MCTATSKEKYYVDVYRSTGNGQYRWVRQLEAKYYEMGASDSTTKKGDLLCLNYDNLNRMYSIMVSDTECTHIDMSAADEMALWEKGTYTHQ